MKSEHAYSISRQSQTIRDDGAVI